jgi:thioesterase domain-containing protein/acyl carrier protein
VRAKAGEPSVKSEARNPTEQTLVTIWRELLNLENIGIQDDFFELGGHSLSVVRLFARIEETFGVRLPSTSILQAPTIAALAKMINEDQTGVEENVLIPIQTQGKKLPFFCVHGVGGGVLGYRDLAVELDQDQPFYGLQAVGLEHPEKSDHSIESMAARYIEAMRAVQPHGPYRIGGYCFGGVVAYEMAHQLEEQGEQVSLLALFEGFLPVIRNKHEPLPKRLRIFLQQIPGWLKDYASMSPEDMRSRMRSTVNRLRAKLQRREDLQKRARVEEILEMDLSLVPDRSVELTQIHSRALHAYAASPYQGKVTLFRARHRSVNEVIFGSLDETMGWRDLARGGVDVRTVDGFHRNIHLPPYIHSLASELNSSLRLQATKE